MAKKKSKKTVKAKVSPKKAAPKKAAPAKSKVKKAKASPVKTVDKKAKSKKTTQKLVTSKDIVPAKLYSKKEAVPVLAEIVDNAIVPRGSTQLTPVGDGLSHYLAGINKYPLLSREQELIIAERYYKNKNPKDAEILVTSNLRFVVKVAAEYSKFGNKLIDLIQEGNVGLMHAVKEFNPYKGVRLITYAVWWIRGYIQEYLMRHHSMVRIGTTQNQRKLFYHLQKEKNHLDQIGQESSVKLLSSRLGIPEDEIRSMEGRMSGRDVSLDAPVSDESGSTHRLDMEASDDLSIDDQLAQQEDLHLLHEKINLLKPQLSEKELLLLEKRLLADQPVTLQEIGEQWGVTREAVRQMEARLMKKLKDEMENT